MKFKNAKALLRYVLWVAAAAALALSRVEAANYALRTGPNAFFRTVSYTVSQTSSSGTTIEAWILPTGPGVIFNEVHAFDISVWDYSLAEIASNGDLLIGMPGLNGVAVAGKITFGTWNHVALRYEVSTKRLDGFVNGVKGTGFATGTRSTQSTSYLAFGRNATHNLGAGGSLPADFDEVRVWNYARTDGDIAASYNTTIETTAFGLVQNFHLDDGAGTDTTPITDSSGTQSGANVNAQWVFSGILVPNQPVVGNLSADVSNPANVILKADINPNGAETTVYFQYGPTTSYGTNSDVIVLPAQNNPTNLTFKIAGLPPGSYNFQVVTSNSVSQVVSSNVVFQIPGPGGLAVRYAGAAYIRTSKITRPFFTNATVTIEMWFEAQPGVLINEVDALAPTSWDYSWLEVLADGTLRAGLPNVPSVNAGVLQLGTWYHVAFRYDSTTSDLDIFLNGDKAATTHGTRAVPWDSSRTVYFAFGRGGPGNLGPGAFYHGKMDEIRIWRTARSDQQIAFEMNLLLSGKDTNLFSLWSFETLSGGLSPDRSQSADPATFVNSPDLVPSPVSLVADQRPSVLSTSVQDLLGAGLALNGSVASSTANASVYFLWGAGQPTNVVGPITIGTGTNSVQTLLSGLQGGASYTYSILASNSFGAIQGAVGTFVKVGWAGYSLSLVTNAYFRTSGNQKPYFTDETITVEIWVKPKKAGVIMSETDIAAPTQLDSSLIEVLTSGNVIAGFPGVPAVIVGHIDLNVWNNIVLRYDKSSQRMDAFVNGVKSATSSSGDRVAGWEIGRATYYTFGKATRDKIGTGEGLNAEWDEIRLWNAARSDADILANYNKKLLGSESGMVAYYRFDDQSAVTDSSRHNDNGAISGTGSFVISGAPVDASFKPIQLATNGSVTVQFFGIAAREVQLEFTTDFVTWTPGPTGLANSLGIATINAGATTDSPIRFFRGKQL